MSVTWIIYSNPFVVEAVMASVRDDDVVGQVYVHGLGGFPHEFRQPLVVVAGVQGCRRDGCG